MGKLIVILALSVMLIPLSYAENTPQFNPNNPHVVVETQILKIKVQKAKEHYFNSFFNSLAYNQAQLILGKTFNLPETAQAPVETPANSNDEFTQAEASPQAAQNTPTKAANKNTKKSNQDPGAKWR